LIKSDEGTMHTILVVDDDDQMRQFWTDVLMEQGYTVLTADNGATALELIDQQTPTLIIADILMPGIDGIELCLSLRKLDTTASIPIVVCSATQEAAIQNECSYTAFFTKPFNLNQLLNVVASYTTA
jgi:CheY-like chemotaxis protein